MKIPDFKTEQWMTEHEQNVQYNMTDTCVPYLTYKELTMMDHGRLLDDLKLDYGEITGDNRLKDEILKLYTTGTKENITMDHGCLHADETVMQTMLNYGDRVIVFTPGYQQFTDYPRSLGCEVTEIPLLEEGGWQPDMELLEKEMRIKTKMIILNNPSNPTGTYFEGEVLEKLLSLAKAQGTYILVDEVYRDYRTEPSISDLYDRGIATNSLSKMYGLAGIRLGWIKANKEVIEKINIRRDYSFISTGPLADTLALIALQNKDDLLDKGKKVIEENKKIIVEFLENNKKFHLVMPKAGTVCFLEYDCDVNSEIFAKSLLEKYSVFYVPGSCFDREKHLRLSFTHDPNHLKRGLELTAKYLEEVSHE